MTALAAPPERMDADPSRREAAPPASSRRKSAPAASSRRGAAPAAPSRRQAAQATAARLAERASAAVVTRGTVPLLYWHVSRGRSWLVLAMCTRDVANSAAGNSCLGGHRVGRRAYRDWFDRMFRLTRSVRPTAEGVVVAGTLARGSVEVTFSDPVVSPDGQLFLNHGQHRFELRNGRIAAVELDWDPRIAQSCCEHTASLGRTEARALPL